MVFNRPGAAMGWFEILLVADHFFTCTLLPFFFFLTNCVHARKLLFILGLLEFFNERESFLDECSADCAISIDTVCLPDHQYCLHLLQNPKSHLIPRSLITSLLLY